MKKLFLFLFLFVQIFILFGCSESGNVFEFIIYEDIDEYITMVTSADYPPFELITVDDEGKSTVEGIDIEIAKEIAKRAKKNLRVIHKGFDFILTDIKRENADFALAGLSPTYSRKKVFDFSESYFTDNLGAQVLLVKSDSDIYSIEDINKSSYRVGAQSGSVQADLAREFTSDAYLKMVQNINELFLDLERNTIKGLFTESVVADRYISENRISLRKIEIEVPDEYNNYAAVVKKGNDVLLKLINECIIDLIETGKIAEWVEIFKEKENGI